MAPLDMIKEWKRGCGNTQPTMNGNPEDCPEFTRALIDALERRLRLYEHGDNEPPKH